MKKFSLISCINKVGVIGNDDELIYHIKSDLNNFKRMTSGNVVIMGRKTYESLPKHPLPNRINIIITRNDFVTYSDNEIVVHSISDAIRLCNEEFGHLECFVIGGGQIYSEFLKRDCVDKLYLTEVQDDKCGNILFPQIDFSEWREFYISNLQKDTDCDYSYVFKILVKKY